MWPLGAALTDRNSAPVKTVRCIDCHAHIIDPARFPFVDGAGYRPLSHEVGEAAAYSALRARHDVAAALLVQPSCYEFDNSAMLHAIEHSEGRLKGIVVIAPHTALSELAKLAIAGIVGIRINLLHTPANYLLGADAALMLEHARDFGWWVEVCAKSDVWADVAPVLAASGVRILIDHFGLPDISGGPSQPGFQAVLDLGRNAGAVVKLSAPFRLTNQPPPYGELGPYVVALLDAFGFERCIWGSDWPFLGMPRAIDYGSLPHALDNWIPNHQERELVLWRNAVHLFGIAMAI
jgi:predicted TIM-barrel fold metal-dependent hydrolase